MKRFLLLLIVCSQLVCLNACGKSVESDTWLDNANLESRETPSMLYDAALLEKTLVLYTDTTRIFITKKAFEEAYPGLTVEVHDIRSSDIIDLLRESSGSGELLCDIVICSDTGGALYADLEPSGTLYKYIPYDIEDKILPQYNGSLLEFVGEGVQIFYNSDAYASPPISNWWELTEPTWNGKIYMGDPVRSHSAFTLLCAMIYYSDEMAQAYEEFYGEVLSIPEDSCAGQEYWRMLVENNIQFTSTSEEAMEQVGMPRQADPPVAIMVSSKARKAEVGFAISPIYNIVPSTGVYTPNNIMIVHGATSINTAKLFIRFLLGEADGTGEGYKPYLQEGTWSVRSDILSVTQIPLENAGFWNLDKEWYAENSDGVWEFWLDLREQGGKKEVYGTLR